MCCWQSENFKQKFHSFLQFFFRESDRNTPTFNDKELTVIVFKWALFLKWVFAKFDLLFTIIYYKMRRKFITKCISLLQNASVLTINYWLRLIFWIKLFGSQVYVRQYVFIMRDIILRGMGMVMNYSVTFKIFLTSNFSRKHEILHFFDNTFIFRSHFMCLCK